MPSPGRWCLPALILLDEPTSALDRTVQRQVVELLRNLQQKYNLTYLFISHDLAVVRALSHQLMASSMGRWLNRGMRRQSSMHRNIRIPGSYWRRRFWRWSLREAAPGQLARVMRAWAARCPLPGYRSSLTSANGRHHLPGTGLNTAYGRTRLGNEIYRIGRFLAAALDLADRLVGQQMIVRDHRIDLGRGGAGAPRQFAHFIGHDGEAPPLVAGARSFDRGIQGRRPFATQWPQWSARSY